MDDNKRYYWIKLKTDFFNQETIDFLLSQTNGCEYVVLYQMLCLKTANNNGILSSNIGELIVPYDISKISRDTKYFNEDTIRVALELYKQLGLIYEGDNNLLQITNFEDLVGSETRWAKYKRDERKLEIVQPKSNKSIEIRDKSLEKDIEIDIEKDIYHKYGTYKRVKLTEEQYNKLVEDFTKDVVDKKIEQIDEYVEMNNNKNKYKNFNLVIRKAIKEKWFENNKSKFNTESARERAERLGLI